MGSFLREVGYALRQLRRLPVFTLTAVLTLAFGIGATTAIFSIVEGVLLRPLPFVAPDRLVTLGDKLEGVTYADGEAVGVTAPGVVTYMQDTHAFSSVGGFQAANYELSGLGEPSQINAARMTASMFQVLGVSPLMGRAFTQQEDEGGQQVVLLSYESWQDRYHADAHVLGQKVLLDRKPYAIIGVMRRSFEFPLTPGVLNRSELWLPMSLTQTEIAGGAGAWNYSLVGRLKPGVTPLQAQEDAGGAAQEIMRNFPPALASRRIHPFVQRLDEETVFEARPSVRMLFFAVIVVLFIACANLAGLLLVRVIRRRREISVRLALGASGAAILRQTLVETLLLSVAGGVLGLGLAFVALRVGLSFLPETLPRVSSITLDWEVAGFALALAVLTGLLCGIVPAFAAARTSVNDALKEGGRTGSAGAGHGRLRSALVVVELAVALVLLTGSGLLMRSFQKMRSVDLGFRTDHTLTASYSLPKQQYSTQAAIDAFTSSLRLKLEQTAGVEAAGLTTLLPAASNDYRATFTPDGYVAPQGAGLNLAWVPQVMGDYFQAQGISVIRGRGFTATDDLAGAPLVAIVNRALADKYWPGQDPIGKRVHRGPAQATKLPWMTVVGEIGDVKQMAADQPTGMQIYVPASQVKASAGSFATASFVTGSRGSIVVRGQAPPEQMAGSLRAIVHSLDPQLPLTDVESMDHVVGEGQASRRFMTILISAFAGGALLLALLGIYSVIAFSAAMRAHEMAIRLALGAQRASVMRLVLGSAAKLGLLGSGIGVIAAVFAMRLLRSMLFEVDPVDPVVIGVAAVAIMLLTLAASVAPARRVAGVEPVEALRSE